VRLREQARRDQLAAFLLLVWTMTIGLASIALATAERHARGLFTLAVTSPLASALIVTAVAEGRLGVGGLIRPGLVWRFPLRWYLLATLAIGAVYFAAGTVAGSLLLLARTRSVLACMVLHLSINTWAAIMDLPAGSLGPLVAGRALLFVGAIALMPRPLLRRPA
jgi:hypothetical protein